MSKYKKLKRNVRIVKQHHKTAQQYLRSEINHWKVLKSCDLLMSNRAQLTQACTLVDICEPCFEKQSAHRLQ